MHQISDVHIDVIFVRIQTFVQDFFWNELNAPIFVFVCLMYFLPSSLCLDWICISSFQVTRNDFAKSMWINLPLPSFFLLCLYVDSLDLRGYSVSAWLKHLGVDTCAPDKSICQYLFYYSSVVTFKIDYPMALQLLLLVSWFYFFWDQLLVIVLLSYCLSSHFSFFISMQCFSW